MFIANATLKFTTLRADCKLKKIILLTNLLLSGCAATPDTAFYVLEPLAKTSAPQPREKPLIIGIGPLSVPTLLERKQIVTRSDNHSVQIAEFHQWAAPLKDNVMQVIRHNIATLQPNVIVRAYPWSAFGKVDYHIVIDLTRLDGQLGNAVNLEATWAILNESTHQTIQHGQTTLKQPSTANHYGANVAASSVLLKQFSDELARAVQALPSK